MDDIAKRLGRRIREARDVARMTQEELAERLSTQKAEISRWERGVSSPSVRRLAAVATALATDVQNLLAPDGQRVAGKRRPDVVRLAAYLRGKTPEEVEAIDQIVRAIFAIRGRRG